MSTLPVYAAWASALTGADSVAALDNTKLQDQSLVIAAVPGDKMYFYTFNATSVLAEKSPEIITAANGIGRFILLPTYPAFITEEPIDFISGDTTPSVLSGNVFNVPAVVTITDFDDAPSSGTKVIEVIAGVDNVVIQYNVSKIKLQGGIDVSMNTGDSIQFRHISGVWVEKLRSLL